METSVNNKCKAFTSLEQSRKLAEILPLESADMYYEDDISVEFGHGWHPQHIPCWSLAALLSVLPEPSLIRNSEGRWLLRSWDRNKYPWSIGNYVNPVDACYEMILKLHEQNVL